MYNYLLIAHLFGVLLTATVICSAIFYSRKKQPFFLQHAWALGMVAILELVSGTLLMLSSGQYGRGCVSLGVYIAVIVAVELIIIRSCKYQYELRTKIYRD